MRAVRMALNHLRTGAQGIGNRCGLEHAVVDLVDHVPVAGKDGLAGLLPGMWIKCGSPPTEAPLCPLFSVRRDKGGR